MAITKHQLEQAYIKHCKTYGGVKEDYFAGLYLAQFCGVSFESIAHQVAFGGNDYGFDAFHIDRELRNLYLFQFKWSDDHHQFKGSFERLIVAGIERIFGNPLQDQNQNQVILQLKAKLRENESIVNKVLIHFVFNGDPEAAERSAVLDSLREDLEAKKYLIDQYFGERKVSLGFQYISNHSKRVAGVSHTKKTHRYSIRLEQRISASGPTRESLTVSFVPLMDLQNIYADMGQKFLERNIRYSLDPDKAPNRALRQTFGEVMDGVQSPEVFAFNHNGVTLSAEKLEVGEAGEAIITEPRLLNGAQTVTSLSKFLQDQAGNKNLARSRQNLEAVRVLAKIICSASERFVVNTTICTNRQNPVSPWNLRASDSTQLEYQDRFREGLGIYYERQEKAFGSLTDEDLEELNIDQGKAIQLKPLAQTLLAVQGEVDKMSRLTDVFESNKIYQDTFRISYVQGDLRKVVLAYKIHFRLRRIVEAIEEVGSIKYHYMERAKNLVWSLLIQGMLNDPALSDLCETHGSQLTMESDFTDYLKGLATKRVRMMIAEAVETTEYLDLLKQEKYSFLRSKVFYQKCMSAARGKYGWEKKSF